MRYLVRVICSYPVDAVDAKDALATVPLVVRMRYTSCLAEGVTEILDAETKEVVLKAVLDQEKLKGRK